MKKTKNFCIAVAITLMVFSYAQKGFAGSGEDIFSPEIERAVDKALSAWTSEDARALKAAIETLTLNETYLMAVGKSNKKSSYLALVPKTLSDNFSAVTAYIFLIRKDREGVTLWPLSLFEGKRFELDQKGAR
jgi:hypothetical protein